MNYFFTVLFLSFVGFFWPVKAAIIYNYNPCLRLYNDESQTLRDIRDRDGNQIVTKQPPVITNDMRYSEWVDALNKYAAWHKEQLETNPLYVCHNLRYHKESIQLVEHLLLCELSLLDLPPEEVLKIYPCPQEASCDVNINPFVSGGTFAMHRNTCKRFDAFKEKYYDPNNFSCHKDLEFSGCEII